MILIVLTTAVIAVFVAATAIYLFALGVLLSRIADNLDESANNVINIARHASVIGPGVTRVNRSASELADALPLLCDDAESLAGEKAPPAHPGPASAPSAGVGVGYLDS